MDAFEVPGSRLEEWTTYVKAEATIKSVLQHRPCTAVRMTIKVGENYFASDGFSVDLLGGEWDAAREIDNAKRQCAEQIARSIIRYEDGIDKLRDVVVDWYG